VDYWRGRFLQYDKHWQHVVLGYRLEPVIPIETEGEPVRGPADAKHTIVLFSDPQCPACSRLDRLIHKAVIPRARKHGGVKLIYKHWPICPDCNPYAARNLHPEACKASLAMEAARMLGGAEMFWRMHDLLLARRRRMKGVDEDWFVGLGQRLGLDREAFREAMRSREAMGRIRDHLEESQQLGKGVLTGEELEDMKINATPTVFLNNRLLRNPRKLRAWSEILKMDPPSAVPAASR
jgi:protein-disulfide isomerase